MEIFKKEKEKKQCDEGSKGRKMMWCKEEVTSQGMHTNSRNYTRQENRVSPKVSRRNQT